MKTGQLLAEIDSPEVDQQLNQAEADLDTAQANSNLAKTTSERYNGLLLTDSVSKQDADDRNGDAARRKPPWRLPAPMSRGSMTCSPSSAWWRPSTAW